MLYQASTTCTHKKPQGVLDEKPHGVSSELGSWPTPKNTIAGLAKMPGSECSHGERAEQAYVHHNSYCYCQGAATSDMSGILKTNIGASQVSLQALSYLTVSTVDAC